MRTHRKAPNKSKQMQNDLNLPLQMDYKFSNRKTTPHVLSQADLSLESNTRNQVMNYRLNDNTVPKMVACYG